MLFVVDVVIVLLVLLGLRVLFGVIFPKVKKEIKLAEIMEDDTKEFIVEKFKGEADKTERLASQIKELDLEETKKNRKIVDDFILSYTVNPPIDTTSTDHGTVDSADCSCSGCD